MLNKKELKQTVEFLTIITECARELLDEVATYEAILSENKTDQKKQSALRRTRKKKQRAKSKASS